MAATYTYQNNAVLTRISQNLIQSATMDDPIFKLFPVTPLNSSKIRWSIKDNYIGLMKVRGIGGEPTSVARVSDNVYEDVPGYYGEFATIDEVEMTDRARGYPDAPDRVGVDDLVADSQEQLTVRQVQRMKQICWTLAVTGTFSVTLPTGGVGHTGTYSAQTATVSPLWSTTATATPLKNFRDLQATYGLGTSTVFDGMAQAWMNSTTLNYALANTNAADYGGKRNAGGGTFNGIAGLNQVLLDQKTPQINIWDDGYLDDSGVFQLYIPNGKVLVVGKRPNGETPGKFMMTYNAVSKGPTAYAKIHDHTDGPSATIPPRIEVHAGFNGGPTIERPTQLVVLTVA